MNKKRRRLLLAQAKQALIGNVNECPTCGLSEEPDYIDGTYSREYYNAYCNSCGTLTVHYSCTTSDASKVNTCRTFWCSVCGYTEVYCPLCGSVAARVTEKCPYGVHDMTFYRCVNCSAVVGDDGSDHVDCEDEGDDYEVLAECPGCGSTDVYSAGSGYCGSCYELVSLYRCAYPSIYDCRSEEFCGNCGGYTPLLNCSCGYSSWNPSILQINVSCPGCGLASPTTYVCPGCASYYCYNCHALVQKIM